MNPAILIGGLIGLTLGGWGGMLVGALLAYFGTQSLRRSSLVSGVERIQSQFLESTFAVMGAICKADGQVTADEIRVAEQVFDRLHLSAAARAKAKSAFNRGKSPGFDLDAEVARFAQVSRGQRVLHQMFIQVQMAALAADGTVHPAERDMLLCVATGLGLTAAEIRQLEAMMHGGTANMASKTDRLADAYKVLGMEPSASDAEIKQAYRRLMSQNHPDKLAAKGLPDSMREMAEEKTREITGAYDLIQQSRTSNAAG